MTKPQAVAHANGTFRNSSWDETPVEQLEGGGKLTRARIAQDFHGDIEGSGAWETVMCYRPDGTAEYAGYLRITGRLGGRTGSFVLDAGGTFAGSEARTRWSVVPGSASGELAGLRGIGSSVAPHGPDGTYSLDFDFD